MSKTEKNRLKRLTKRLERISRKCKTKPKAPVKPEKYCSCGPKVRLEDLVSLDCEMVGVGQDRSCAIARCSLVDYQCRTLCDIYVKPDKPITDYRTFVSGIRPCHMKNAISLEEAVSIISELVKDKIVVGHSLYNDLRLLNGLQKLDTRDTIKCERLKLKALAVNCEKKGLASLSYCLLKKKIQVGEHCSVEDAVATMQLFKYAHFDIRPEGNDCLSSLLTDNYWPSNIFECCDR
ncbi:unnamed protein product [Dimorphilus gyrociliatus]|uniref:Exonuclease domain-containing protein n=1 Tax=Dimorphilus gyrociliatus TaxID=2664684 RepID=A0A7I8V8A8_9ANNE|nr:unnamed protein product [Dimorphilus gyrociliatus]